MKSYDQISCLSPLHFNIHLLAILLSIISLSYGSSNETDRMALLQFKQGITSDPHGVFDSWNASSHFCSWFGVSCGRRHQRVVSLDLQGHNLNGVLSPHVGNLSFLTTLNVQNNSLHGRIPSELGNLFRLQHLVLGNNSLQGDIPSNLSRCYQLRRMILQKNYLSGKIPRGLGNLANLQAFALGANNLTGEIPAYLGNLTSLYFFSVGVNNLVGNVPDELGRLINLNSFLIGENLLSGIVPPSIFNISSLVFIMMPLNQLEGNLPQNLGLSFPNIRSFGIGSNLFSGSIPISLFNATSLELIDMGRNNFVGKFPINTIGSLKNLRRLDLSNNHLIGGSEIGRTFLESLTNCTRLELLDLNSNNFGGVLPNSIGNLSTQLKVLQLGGNQITGTIPRTIENLTRLILLSLDDNFLIGTIFNNLDKFQNLQSFGLSQNRLSGPIPSSICNLTYLYGAYLSQNSLEGRIPDCINNLKILQRLDISHNILSGTIPLLLPNYLIYLNLSGNFFTGQIPQELGRLVSMNSIDVSENGLSGEIPPSIGECLSLEILHLQGNSFQGKIPSSLSSLKGIQNIDLSRNNLTGEIPPNLQNLSFVLYLNLSFNDLQGKVPASGIFSNVSLFSVAGNENICGGVPELGLPNCSTKARHREKNLAQKLAAITISAALFVVSVLAIVVIYHRRNLERRDPAGTSILTDPRVEVSYRDLHQATNAFSSDNFIGSGTFGLVYKGFLSQVERYVAIKVLKLEENGASKSFMAECKALRSVRHRNLMKLLTYCSSLDYAGNEFKALIFELMENGSLEKWLDHDQPRSLNFLQRLNITIDIASALHYLHDLCEAPIIHCDVKPSNILLDGSFVARLTDFGLAKLFFSINDGSQSQITSIGMKGTIGYAPPEYGMGGMASKEGDVYSFGILVLELFSGKWPTHEMFTNGLNLHDFVNNAFPQALWEVMDSSMLSGETNQGARAGSSIHDHSGQLKESLESVFKVGLVCSSPNPTERHKMGDVVKELQLIKSNYV